MTTHRSQERGLLESGWAVAFVAALILGSFFGTGVPAVAAPGCPLPSSGDDLANQPAGCRYFISDPGQGQLQTRAQLVGHKALYKGTAGISDNFLWYSQIANVTISDQNVEWAGCATEPGSGNACPPSLVRDDSRYPTTLPHSSSDSGRVLYDLAADSATFSAFTYGDGWIARSCGNWVEGIDFAEPIPYVTGKKFRDDNRNGSPDAGEQTLAGWEIKITRLSSKYDDQGTGLVGTVTTDASGNYRFNLDGHGPGRYRVHEVPQAGWKNYTPVSYDFDVTAGGGDKRYTYDFGNAETVADAAKTRFEVVSAPANLDVNVASDITVAVTVENLGPADQVAVRDEIQAVLPEDCRTPDPTRSFAATLRRDAPVSKELTFPITCGRPSEHEFEFEDVLTITTPGVTDVNDLNNAATTSVIRPVHAETNLSAQASLTCPDETDVDVAVDCDTDITITNEGFGPIDATAATQLSLPEDCVADPVLATLSFTGLQDGAQQSQAQAFSVTCSHRSYHLIDVSVAVDADDPHVFDRDVADNVAGDGPSIMEVFNDATMAATDVHLVCDQSLAEPNFTCTADAEFSKTGPAPLVEADLWAELSGDEECTISPAANQSHTAILQGTSTQTHQFAWDVSCPVDENLNPFLVTADVTPSDNEPHALDEPGQIDDWWVVPYCLPTVNPHGNKEPQAPGTGMNEDGFYIFGTLPASNDEGVSIRDDESGFVFGPYSNGTRIKWVEANGTEPRESEMGGNNGNGKGQALAVDYQIHANGDAQAFYTDEKGTEVFVTCLVPPFPK